MSDTVNSIALFSVNFDSVFNVLAKIIFDA